MASVREPRRPRALQPSDIAWIAAMPCALATILAAILLGPPLGHAFFEPGSEAFWPGIPRAPEPVEHARYLIAVLGPFALAGTIVMLAHRELALAPRLARVAVRASRVLLLVFLAICFLALNDVLFHAYVPPFQPSRLFAHSALAISLALPLVLWIVLRNSSAAGFLARHALPETRARRVACLLLAAAFTAVWVLSAYNSERTAGLAAGNNLIPWDMAEAFAVLDGRTPLVDFHSQYTQLWTYPIAAAMTVFGGSIETWTATLGLLDAVALLAIYAVLHRIVHSSLLTLGLFLPVLATGFVQAIPVKIYTLWPLRYVAPYLVAWLVARHLDGAAPRRAWILFAVAGLAVVNNPEFGVAAFAGTLVALVCVAPPRRWPDVARLLGNAAAGAAVAGLLVSALTLARAGELPHFAWVLEFSRLFGVGGWVLEPMATLGFHLVVYATFAAAIASAAVRAVRDSSEPVLTGMLGWSGTFGLLAGSYFVGRSDPVAIITLYSAWAFSLALVLVIALRQLAARSWHRPTVPELVVLFGLGLMLTSLVQLPTPWSQLDRLRQRTPTEVFKQEQATAFVARFADHGAKVAILIPLGHRIAYDLGLVNVAPYASAESIATKEQLQTTLDAVRQAKLHTVFISSESMLKEQLAALQDAGFAPRHQDGNLIVLSDAHR